MKPPPARVLAGFGVSDVTPVLLDGGRGTTWRAGDAVLKPADLSAESIWRADVLDTLRSTPEFRVARPRRAGDGGWLVDGWEAWDVVSGVEDHQRPDDVIRAGMAFHAALADLPRPELLDVRDDPWTRGDRMAWDEIPIEGTDVAMNLLRPLARMRRPVRSPSQPVHGDLLGNVLFSDDGLPPAIIDWPVYYRPPGWAAAVVVADAVTWYGADMTLVNRWSHLPEWNQMLIRALIYRITTDDAAAYRPLVRHVAEL